MVYKKKIILGLCLLVLAVLVAGDSYLNTGSGDLVLNPAGTIKAIKDFSLESDINRLFLTDTGEVAPAGRFLIYNDGDFLYLYGRNAADDGWEIITIFERAADGGLVTFSGSDGVKLDGGALDMDSHQISNLDRIESDGSGELIFDSLNDQNMLFRTLNGASVKKNRIRIYGDQDVAEIAVTNANLNLYDTLISSDYESIRRDSDESFLKLGGSSDWGHGSELLMYAGDHASRPGWVIFDIGDARSGETEDSYFKIRYNADSSTTDVLIVDKDGDTEVAGDLYPSSDNSSDLGIAGQFWKDIRYKGSLITSSIGFDKSVLEKQGITALDVITNLDTLPGSHELDHDTIPDNLKIEEDWVETKCLEEGQVCVEIDENGTCGSFEKGCTDSKEIEHTSEYIDMSKLYWLNIQAVQELKKENDMLKEELCKKDTSYNFC